MSALFVSASSRSLRNAAPIVTAFPFSVGFWALAASLGVGKDMVTWGTGATVIARCQMNSGNVFVLATTGDAQVTGTVVANKWFYVVARFINATNARMSVLSLDGISGNCQCVISSTTSGMTTGSIGASCLTTATVFMDGLIAEFWQANNDIQPDGLALSESTLKRLAFMGPFSIPRVADSLVDYRSLRRAIGSEQDQFPDFFGNIRQKQVWVNNNGVIRGAHPPLAPGYPGPSSPQIARMF